MARLTDGGSPDPVVVASTFEELERLRAEWGLISWPRLDGELDYYTCVLRNRPEVVQPCGVLVEAIAEPVVAAAGRIENIMLPARLGYWTVLEPRVRSLTVAVAGTANGASLNDHARKLSAALLDVLERGGADVLWLQSTPVDSGLVDSLAEMVGPFRRQGMIEQRWHRRILLPATFDEFVASRSRRVREMIRRRRRKVESAFGDHLTLEVMRNNADLPRLVKDVETVAQKTYQRRMGVGFSGSASERALLELATDRGWHMGYVLYLKGIPIAFWTGWTYRRAFCSSATGYDPAYSEHGIGTYLLIRMVEDFCGDEDLDTVDFGPGDASYKEQFGNDAWLEQDVYVFPRTARGVVRSIMRTGIGAAERSTKKVLEQTGHAARVRRKLRERA